MDLTNIANSHGWSTDGIAICDLVRPASSANIEPSVYHPSDTELGDIVFWLSASCAS